jgi:hypothetical protein
MKLIPSSILLSNRRPEKCGFEKNKKGKSIGSDSPSDIGI